MASSLGTTVTIQSHDTRGTCGWCTTDTTYVNCAGLGRYGYTITFGAGNTGDQNEITMQAAGCDEDGCQPRYSGMYIQQQQVHSTGTVSASNGVYTYVGGTSHATDIWPKSNAGAGGGGAVSTNFCLVDGGEKYVLYQYASAGDNNGKVFTAASCADATGITFVEEMTALATTQTNLLRLRKMGDFEGTHDEAFAVGMPQVGTYFRSVTTEITRGTKESTECSGRGSCDSAAGICECFDGYTGEACETQTVLI